MLVYQLHGSHGPWIHEGHHHRQWSHSKQQDKFGDTLLEILIKLMFWICHFIGQTTFLDVQSQVRINGFMDYNFLIHGTCWGYNQMTNLLLTSMDIHVVRNGHLTPGITKYTVCVNFSSSFLWVVWTSNQGSAYKLQFNQNIKQLNIWIQSPVS